MPCGCVLLAYVGLATMLDGPPGTIHFQIDSWNNTSWGFHNIDRDQTRCELAVSSDGSRRNRCESAYFKHYFVPDGTWSFHSLYVRPTNEGFRIDDQARTAEGGPCSFTWELRRTIADDDGKCSRTARERLPDGQLSGPGEVAGHRVVRYRSTDDQGNQVMLSLAPGLTCEVMEEIQTSPGTLGIPAYRRHYRVVSYRRGEPPRELFRLPAGYSVRPGRQ